MMSSTVVAAQNAERVGDAASDLLIYICACRLSASCVHGHSCLVIQGNPGYHQSAGIVSSYHEKPCAASNFGTRLTLKSTATANKMTSSLDVMLSLTLAG